MLTKSRNLSSVFQLYTCFEDNNYVYLVIEMGHRGEMQGYIRQNGPVSESEGKISSYMLLFAKLVNFNFLGCVSLGPLAY